MRARRRIQKPDVFAEGMSQVQSFLMQDDWRHEISTHDKHKDSYYKPAFLKDIMDKYSWGAQGVLESYADYIKLKAKIDLTEEKLASYIMQSQYCPWVFEFVTAAYNDKVLKSYLDDSKLSDQLKVAIASGSWNTVVNTILSDLNKSDYPLAKEVGNRYNMALAQSHVKKVTMKPKMDHNINEEVIEADIAPPPHPMAPTAPPTPGSGSPTPNTAPNTNNQPAPTPAIQNNMGIPTPPSNQPAPQNNQQNQNGEIVEADDETGKSSVTISFEPQVTVENNHPNEEVIEADDNDALIPTDSEDALTDLMDTSNPMGPQYKNIGTSPASSGFPFARPMEYTTERYDINRNIDPSNYRMQWT